MNRLLLFLFLALPRVTMALTAHEGAVFVGHPENTATLFSVRAGDQEYRVRLFFVEAPHPAPAGEALLAEESALQQHFGLAAPAPLRSEAGRALAAVQEKLSEPFLLHLPADAPPGTEVRGVVTTRQGSDLAAYLARAGFARVHGPGTDMPRGIRESEMRHLLKDAVAAAMLERAGIWAHTDPVRLPAMRAQYRRERPEVVADETPVTPAPVPETTSPSPGPPPVETPGTQPVNVNTAGIEQLQTLPGVDEMLAGRIIRGRPYRIPQDLLDVRGIGENMLNSWEGKITTR